ncbi:hypothetical protein AB1E22_06815 [Buttiauxella gaviniae]|uniref:Uncharacterized protein n=1 Tax=Buttiauxella gaviniae TaxID=82990 RepID=A0ABV3NSA5_9ENTR
MPVQRQGIVNAARTNDTPGSIVRVVSAQAQTSWVNPSENTVYSIKKDATLPEIIFEFRTDQSGPYQWTWSIKWDAKASGLRERSRNGKVLKTFSKNGTFSSAEKIWNVDFGEETIGGELTVKVKIGNVEIERRVSIIGQNPDLEDITTFINGEEGLSGFDKLLEQETAAKHFINFDSQPITSFDQGYGITQMTNPVPTYTQVWSWKENILGGATLYRQKRQEAENYLSAHGRSYTEDQLQHETFSRWNGGSYYVWDQVQLQWVRRNNILCDTHTGNIGWDMNNPENTNRTEGELHERDNENYPSGTAGQNDEHPWRYTGICYADHILDE